MAFEGTLQEFTVNMHGHTIEYPFIEAQQGDTASRKVRIHLKTFGGADFLIPYGATAVLSVTKTDGHKILNNCEIEDSSTVVITLTSQTLACPGKQLSQIYIFADKWDIKTQKFYIHAPKAAYSDDAVQSTDEYGILLELIERIENLGGGGSGATEEQLEQIEQNKNDITQLKSDLNNIYQNANKDENIDFTVILGVINDSYTGTTSNDPNYKYRVYQFPLISGAEYYFSKGVGATDFIRMGISPNQFSNGISCVAVTPTKVENELVWKWTCDVDTSVYKYGFIYPGNATLTGTVTYEERTGSVLKLIDDANNLIMDLIMDMLSTQHSIRGFSEYDDIITTYTNKYIDKNGLFVNGVAKTKEEIYDWVLNGNNYLYRGKITKSGNKILDKDGNELILTGIGTHYLTRFDELHTKEAFESLKYYGINCIRLSMYLNSGVIDDAYIAAPQKNKDIISELVPMLTELGFYIIIDWHAYSVVDPDGDSTQYATEQAEFFTWASTEFANYDNILYELFNEPLGNTASELLPQLQTCSNIIRSNVPDAILITGFGSDYDAVMIQVVEDNDLDMFVTAHPYVADSTVNMRPCKTLIEQGKAMFISEWGNSAFSGNGITNDAAAEEWMDYLYSKGVSQCVWKYTYNDSTTAVLKNDSVKIKHYYSKGGFNREDLTHNGKFYFDKIQELNFAK